MARMQISRWTLLALLLAVIAGTGAKPPVLPETLTGKVVGVNDGDTLSLLVGKQLFKVRLEGIDAPERGQDFGTPAKKALSDLVFGKTVTVVTHGEDRYGRVLGSVTVGDMAVNRALVRDGWAWHYTQYSSDAELAGAEKEARAAHAGLWQGKNQIAPWEWRKTEKDRRVAKAKSEARPMKAARPPPAASKSEQKQTAEPVRSHWLNTESDVRHNASCRWFKNTKSGRTSGPDEGRACKICGG